MSDTYTINDLERGQEEAVCRLVQKSFMDSVAKDCTHEGVKNFLLETTPESIANRIKSNYFILVASQQEQIVGMIEVKNNEHITKLFVDDSYRKNGIGKRLLTKAVSVCIKRNPSLTFISVKSSRAAVIVYEKMGFQKCGDARTERGIYYVPMMLGKDNFPK